MDSKDQQKKDANWADMSDEDVDENQQLGEARRAPAQKPEGQPERPKNIPPPVKGVKNSRGDYIVSSLNIIELQTQTKKKDEEVEEDSDSESEGYGDEDDAQEENTVQEATQESKLSSAFDSNPEPKQKQLSKKERKAQEEAELAKLLSEMGVSEENKQEPKKEEQKPQVAAPSENNSKNKKKKEKKKAKQEEESKQDGKAAVEMTPEERAAAVKAAMNKRGAVQQKVTKEDKAAVALKVKAEKEKRGAKKPKVHGTTTLH
jgi:neurofilament medium polypeptide (neurofilament 3)